MFLFSFLDSVTLLLYFLTLFSSDFFGCSQIYLRLFRHYLICMRQRGLKRYRSYCLYLLWFFVNVTQRQGLSLNLFFLYKYQGLSLFYSLSHLCRMFSGLYSNYLFYMLLMHYRLCTHLHLWFFQIFFYCAQFLHLI